MSYAINRVGNSHRNSLAHLTVQIAKNAANKLSSKAVQHKNKTKIENVTIKCKQISKNKKNTIHYKDKSNNSMIKQRDIAIPLIQNIQRNCKALKNIYNKNGKLCRSSMQSKESNNSQKTKIKIEDKKQKSNKFIKKQKKEVKQKSISKKKQNNKIENQQHKSSMGHYQHASISNRSSTANLMELYKFYKKSFDININNCMRLSNTAKSKSISMSGHPAYSTSISRNSCIKDPTTSYKDHTDKNYRQQHHHNGSIKQEKFNQNLCQNDSHKQSISSLYQQTESLSHDKINANLHRDNSRKNQRSKQEIIKPKLQPFNILEPKAPKINMGNDLNYKIFPQNHYEPIMEINEQVTLLNVNQRINEEYTKSQQKTQMISHSNKLINNSNKVSQLIQPRQFTIHDLCAAEIGLSCNQRAILPHESELDSLAGCEITMQENNYIDIDQKQLISLQF